MSDQYVTHADAARPVQADVLEKCARLFGWRELAFHHGRWLVGEHHYPHGRYKDFDTVSDGDLLLTILNKAAEMGERIDLSFLPNAKVWGMGSTQSPSRIRQYANTPLEAALLAFAQLEAPHDR